MPETFAPFKHEVERAQDSVCDGLRQIQELALCGQAVEQASVEASNVCLDFPNGLHQFAQDETGAVGQFAWQGVEQFFVTGLGRRLARVSPSRRGLPVMRALIMTRAL
jgi:hypothetical protein